MRATCSVDGCERSAVGQGLCQKHYMRMRRNGRTDDIRKNARGECLESGCGLPAAAFGRCDLHYRRERRGDSPDGAQRGAIRSTPRNCKRCGEPMQRYRKSYCSETCAVAVRRARLIADRYGVTEEWYDAQLARQGGGCWICGATESGNGKPRLSIDHDHETGLVRGLLCAWCNRGIGYFGDNPDQMRRAIAYLEAFALDRMTAGGAT